MARKNAELAKRFGSLIRVRRKALEMTQLDLAVEAGLSEAYISQLERGLKSPSLLAIVELAKALKIKGSGLLDDAGE